MHHPTCSADGGMKVTFLPEIIVKKEAFASKTTNLTLKQNNFFHEFSKQNNSTIDEVVIWFWFSLFGPLQTGDDVMYKNVWKRRKFFWKFRLMLVIVGKLKKTVAN
jgi:hypothetical protein